MINFDTFEIEGLILTRPKVHKDERGHFIERYNQAEFENIGITCKFIQDNFSKSQKNVLRGLHFQQTP